MTGKLADTVMSVRNGEQIARKYQPVVYNPNTPAQIETRAKMKLMSQVSAVLSPFIAMRREGSVSARNFFVKENYGTATYSDSHADISLTQIKLTKSVVGLTPITATRSESELSVALAYATTNLNRVVYLAVFRQYDGTLRIAGSTVVEASSNNINFSGTINILTSAQIGLVVYAYGVRDNTESARVTFSNMTVTAENIANVIATRQLTESDVTLTETVSTMVAASTNANHAVNPEGNDENRSSKKK